MDLPMSEYRCHKLVAIDRSAIVADPRRHEDLRPPRETRAKTAEAKDPLVDVDSHS